MKGSNLELQKVVGSNLEPILECSNTYLNKRTILIKLCMQRSSTATLKTNVLPFYNSAFYHIMIQNFIISFFIDVPATYTTS